MQADPEEVLKTLHEAFSGIDPFGDEVDKEDYNRGANIEIPLKLSFEESVFGVDKELNLDVRVECDSCNGSGMGPEGVKKDCEICLTKGYV